MRSAVNRIEYGTPLGNSSNNLDIVSSASHDNSSAQPGYFSIAHNLHRRIR